jgi:hypothetical protein
MTKKSIGAIQVICQTLLFAFISVVLFACSVPSVKDWADPAIGEPIDKIIEVTKRPGSYISRNGKKIQKYRIGNENFTYINPVGDGCDVYWEVNSSGIIVSYRLVGNGCW